MLWTRLIALSLTLAAAGACSPSGAPDPIPRPQRAPIPTDFLGVQIGEKFTPHPCSDAGGAQTPSVCTSPNGGLIIAASHRPYGMAGDVYLTQDSAGVVEQIIATVEAGHDGSIARTMVEKYGAPDFIRDDGEHHWIGERVSVLYKPAAHHQEGMIVVASRNLLDRQRQAKEEAKSRKL